MNKFNNSSPDDKTFVVITNKEVYEELVNLRSENDQQHQQIMALMAEQKATTSTELAKMKGNINLAKGVGATAIAIATYAVIWLWNIVSKP